MAADVDTVALIIHGARDSPHHVALLEHERHYIERVNNSRAAVKPAGPAPMITAVRSGGLRLGGALISSLSQRTAPGTAHGCHAQKYPKQAAPNGLIQKIRAIQCIALLRDKARVANQAAQFFFGGL